MPWIYHHIMTVHYGMQQFPQKKLGCSYEQIMSGGKPQQKPHTLRTAYLSPHCVQLRMLRGSWQCPPTSRAGDGGQTQTLSAPSIALWIPCGHTTVGLKAVYLKRVHLPLKLITWVRCSFSVLVSVMPLPSSLQLPFPQPLWRAT